MSDALREAVRQALPGVRSDLEALIQIPSVSADPGASTSPPFAAIERDGRLYGRGSADDKAGVAAHLAVLRAYHGWPPVGVTVFVEGEEEIGSPTLGALLERYRDQLAADVIVLADSANLE